MNLPAALPDEFFVKVTPGAARTEVVAWADGVLRVRLHASPRDGMANRALLELLSEHTGILRSAFCIVRGLKSRLKRVRKGKS